MKLKLTAEGHAEVLDGKPVYVADDGKEIAFDAVGTDATIKRLNAEAKSHRIRAEEAEAKAKPFEGLDAEAARKAIDAVKNIDMKKLVDAGEIETVKSEITKGFQSQLDASKAERDALAQQLYAEKVGGSFARSKFVAEKLAIPADLVQARFGSAFKVENGVIVAYDSSGNKLFSRGRPGEVANFDEALEIMVDSVPYRDQILKASGASGSGAASSSSSSSGGKKTVTRAEFDKLPQSQQAAIAVSVGKGEALLVD